MRPVLATASCAAVLLAMLAPAANAVDVVVPSNQIVQGFGCIGATCLDGEVLAGPTIMSKSTDTPGLRLFQTGGGFGSQTWDVAGNETNFFVRDMTNGIHLPFRIRPGAPTSSIDIAATGEVNTAGVIQQSVLGVAPTDTVDGDATLAALRGLTISHYTAAGATHAAPAGADFRAAFALGFSSNTLAPQDVAAIALASVKALDSRVSGLALTPGPKGDTGAKGEVGAEGASAQTASAPDLAAANARIASLERSNLRMAKALASLQKQIRPLARLRSKGTAARTSSTEVGQPGAHASGNADGRG